MHEDEGFNSIPKDYVIGKTKYIVVTGSVISGVGKGVISASIANLLESSGLKVMPFKFDGYLNINAGTLNPFRHGEVFVLDDGMECDMDLGTYERFLNINLSKKNYMTAGQLFQKILSKEKKGEYLGRDVQFIPHVTGEIKKELRERSKGYDIMIIEVGGTVGDIENSYFLEAIRELYIEEGRENVLITNVTYILEPKSLGEQKSKAAQHGLKELMKFGLRPDIVFARSEHPISDKIKSKIAVSISLSKEKVISVPDLETIYKVPIVLYEQKVIDIINKVLNINAKPDISMWKKFVDKLLHPTKEIKIMIAGKYTKVNDSYASIIEALKHAGAWNNTKVIYELVETTNKRLDEAREIIKQFDGIIVPGGFGSRGIEGKINFIRASRELKKPFLGICYGMQLAVIEFARNVCNLSMANTTEVDKTTPHPVITILPNQEGVDLSGTMRLGAYETIIDDNTLAYKIYNKRVIKKRFRHRYEVNPNYIELLSNKGMIFSGESSDGKVKQIAEFADQFFIGTQFHPELTSKPLNPSPIFDALIKSCIKNKY